MKPYRVALIQQQTRVIVEPKERNEIIDENLDRIFELLDWTALRLGDVKLAVFSEYSIIGQYRPRSVDEWLALAETIPGDVTDQIGRKAKERGCYIVGNLYERDDDWPGRLFNTSFIVDPDGKSSSSTGRTTAPTTSTPRTPAPATSIPSTPSVTARTPCSRWRTPISAGWGA